jgi:predicted RNase H-like nuclease
MGVVLGVDACRGGWVAARLEDDGRPPEIEFFAAFDQLVARHRDAAVIAVDIPIGLVDVGEREPDREAKRFVGPRAGSVFLLPARAALEARDHQAARGIAASAGWAGVTAQAYALAKKIFEVDSYIANDRVWEVHPEVSFRAMAGRPLTYSKRSWSGFFERRRILARQGIEIPEDSGLDGNVGSDDVLDAAAAAWSALRIAAGTAQSLPALPTQTDRGRQIAIWY